MNQTLIFAVGICHRLDVLEPDVKLGQTCMLIFMVKIPGIVSGTVWV